MARDFKPEFHDILKFSADTAEADFLFGPEIPKYIDEIFKHAVDLQTAKSEYRDLTQPAPAGYDHQKVVDEMMKHEKWFLERVRTAAKEKFRKYLDISR